MKNFILRNRHFLFPFVVTALSLCLGLAGMEIFLRILEKHYRSHVLDYGHTVDGIMKKGGLLRPGFNAYVIDGWGKKARWVNNSLGFRSDRETTEKPQTNTLRILSLGDSFTAGYRVGQEETFSFLMQKWLNEKRPAEVLVSMIEDPATGFSYLERFGQFLNPHVVFLGITMGNDIAQAYIARNPGGEKIGFEHGLEVYEIPRECLRKRSALEETAWLFDYVYTRLRVVGLIYNQPRPIMSWYKEFRSPKSFDPSHGLGFYLKTPPPEIEEAYRRFFLTLLDYQKFLAQRGIAFAVAIFPQRFQVQPGDWELAVKSYGLDESCFDLMLPNTRIENFCRENSILCIDPTETMAREHLKTETDYYIVLGDMHWNQAGHRVFFASIKEAFAEVVEKAAASSRPVTSSPRR